MLATQETRLNQSYWTLKVVFGLIPIVAGLDKFTNLLTDWKQYLSPLIANVIPAHVFMPIVGVVEIIAGLIVLSRYTRIGAYIVCAWLLCIALQLLTLGRFFDIAARDVAMAAGAFALARLAESHESAAARATAHVPAPAH
jgi:uncharacterized membrane protein YphA (DoxX/SURF4 family)